jgi:hypothetical protein
MCFSHALSLCHGTVCSCVHACTHDDRCGHESGTCSWAESLPRPRCPNHESGRGQGLLRDKSGVVAQMVRHAIARVTHDA